MSIYLTNFHLHRYIVTYAPHIQGSNTHITMLHQYYEMISV